MLLVVQEALTSRVAVARPVDIWASDSSAIIAAYELTWTDQLRASR